MAYTRTYQTLTLEEKLAGFNPDTKKISLRYSQLNSIPQKVLGSHQLQELNLESNNITVLPRSIGKMIHLETLNLRYNKLERLPDTIGQLKQLKHLNLNYCNLTALPDSIKHCQNLEHIHLNSNAFVQFPEVLLQLPKLKSIYLRGSKITSIPAHINCLPNLQELHLANNPLEALPESLLKIPKIRQFTFSSNHFKAFPKILLYLGQLITPKYAYGFSVKPYMPEKSKGHKYSHSLQEFFLRMVRQFDKKELDYEARKNLFAIFQGKSEALAKVPRQYFWQAMQFQNAILNTHAKKALYQDASTKLAASPLNASSHIALLGECSTMSKARFKEKMERNGIKYSIRIKPTTSHVLLNHRATNVKGGADCTAPFITEQQLNQFLESLDEGYLSKAETAHPMTEHLAALLLSSDESNVNLALEMMHGGGFPTGLSNELFVAAKIGPSSNARKAAMKFLSLHVSSKSQQCIRRRFPLTGKDRLVSQNIRYYSNNCPELDGGKIASCLFKNHRKGLIYFLDYSTEEEKTLFLNENILFGTQIKINGIRGLLTIPKVLFRYKETTHLNLKNNHFRTVPMQLGEFPKMTRLDLSNNYLRGVNNSMTKALALTHLDLSKNGLQNIPSILGTMKQLKWINLSNNPFSAVNTKKSGFTKAEIVKRALQKELPNCEIII